MRSAILLGFAADRLFGDPARFHPVAGFGAVAAGVERAAWRDSRVVGAAYAGSLVAGVYVLTARLGRRLVLESAVVWATLGGRSLERAAAALATAVERGDLPEARALAPALVGRDPSQLDGGELSRAAVESVAENASDAVVAPLLWAALLGAPGAAAYRALNTLDAMVGHKTERHLRFGWAAARLDDLANWPAARLTALLAIAVGGAPRAAWSAAWVDGCASEPERRARRGSLRGLARLAPRRAESLRARPGAAAGARKRTGAGRSRRRPRRPAGAARRRRRRAPLRLGRAPMSLRMHGDTVARPGMLDFAVNVWPGERSPALDAVLRGALSDPGYPREQEARAAIARRHGRQPEEVLLLNGACEGFWLLAQALRPQHALCVHPSFTEPEAALLAVGTRVEHVYRRPERDWALPPVPEGAEVVVAGNPNNPTGNLDPAERLLELARPGRLVVVDESFIDFVPGERGTLAGAAAPGVVVVRSLTKLWSLAGIRAGYLLAEPELVERLAGQRQPWGVNAVACAALEHCARDSETPARVAREVAEARDALLAALRVHAWPGSANFLLLRAPNATELRTRLAAAGIAVRPCDSFPGLDETYLRIAVRRPHENARLLEALG
jgi:histidinol-phosphate/aromatic aminotransferase/cobyric acid decarboxylase-like protein